MTYANTLEAINILMKSRQLLSNPDIWCQGEDPNGNVFTLCGALNEVGMDDAIFLKNQDGEGVYSGDLNRGDIPEPAWFLRQAMNQTAPEFGGLIYKWNDAPGRTQEEVVDLITSALGLARVELADLLKSSDGVDMSSVVLSRWGDRNGETLCAMSAVSQMLGYYPLTDMPVEVDPGIAALVNLLNDRANDDTRQRLIHRLVHIPNTGRTDIISLISDVFFPRILDMWWFDEDAGELEICADQRAKASAYATLGERLLKPDGKGGLANGCITLAAALNANDPVTQDILAISAVSRIVPYETGDGWQDLLHILDSALGLSEDAYLEETELSDDFALGFFDGEADFAMLETPEMTINPEPANEKGTFEEIYDFGIRVQWFPALAAMFHDRLEEIAEKILDEVAEIGSTRIWMHRFRFADEQVMIATSWDDDLDMLYADADLVAMLDPVGEVDLGREEGALPLMMPVPASDAKTIN